MKNKTFAKYWLSSVLGVFIASIYPLYMGVRVLSDMIKDGTVQAENYPKYIIPYTPISIAVIFGVLLIPVLHKVVRKYALLTGSCLSIGVFFFTELLLESKVMVTTTVQTTLESWQMFSCYISPEQTKTRTWKAVDVLIGEYSPAFKLHFYIISIVLILSLLNCFYGFGNMLLTGDKRRLKPLILQSISGVVFLGLCIYACFTAFYRTGELQISFISAILMSVFFVVFGVTAGLYTGSFLLGKRRVISVLLPAVIASVTTLVMYIGEMILLSGNLYRFGEGFLFKGLGGIVLAPIDTLVILLSGVVCFLILWILGKNQNYID
jgi:hypothetical protein